MSETKPFFRYLRPVTFDRSRFNTIAKSTGGVSFAVESYTITPSGEYELKLAVAVCPSSQKFDKGVAKRILDTRLKAGHTIIIKAVGLDAESIGRGLVWAADTNRVQAVDHQDDFYKFCVQFALTEYADAVEYILRSHKSADFLAKTSIENIAALGLGDFYREESGG